MPHSPHKLLQKAERRSFVLMDKHFENDIFNLALDPDSDISTAFRQQKSVLPPCSIPKIPAAEKGFVFPKALAAEMPYPPAKACAPNEKYAELIRGSFSGKESELTAVMSSLYHGLKFSESCPELSDMLIGITLCEMRHLVILGKLLLSLGGDPKFFCCLPTNSNAGGWWNAHPNTINYRDTIDKALKNGISAEKAAIAEYKSISEYVDDDGIKAILKRIGADEVLHLEALEGIYSRFCE